METNAVFDFFMRQTQDKFFRKLPLFGAFACTFLLTACTQEIVSAGQLLINLQSSFQYIVDLIISIAYLSGALFFVKGIFAFKIYGEQRTMYSSQVSIKIPITYIVVGIGLLFLPKMISLVSNATFMQANVSLMSYPAGIDWFKSLKASVYDVVQIMGLIAIVRAFFLASVPTSIMSGSQGGGMPKAIVHFMGGIAAVNVDYLVKFISNYT